MVFVTLVGAGVPLTISKITASNKVTNNYSNTYSMVKSALRLEIVFALFLTIIIIVFKNTFTLFLGSNSSYYMLIALIPAIISTGVYTPFKGYLWGEEQYFKVSIVEFIEQIIKIVLLFVLVKINVDLNSLTPLGVAVTISAVISTIIGVVFYFTNGGRLNGKDIKYKPIIESSLPLTTTRFFNSLMQPLISIIIPFKLVALGYTKAQSLSMLGVAMGMTFPLLTIPSTLIGSLAMVLIPEIATMLKAGKSNSLHKQISSSILFTMCCSFICIPFLYALAEPICMLLFNNYDAGLYLKYASWTVIPTGLSAITTSILNSLGKERQTFIYFLISSIITILMVMFLTRVFGIHSLFISLGFGMLVTFILNMQKIKKTINYKHNTLKEIIILTIITIPCTLLTMWLYNIFLIMYGSFISMIISAVISTLAFILLLVSFNILNINVVFNSLKYKKNKKAC